MLFVDVRGRETWSVRLRKDLRLVASENSVLGQISGSRRQEATGGCRKLRKKINDCCFLLGMIKVISSTKMGWLRHVAWVGKNVNPFRILVRNLKERDQREDLWIYERVMLR
jgi:hypothetical protein